MKRLMKTGIFAGVILTIISLSTSSCYKDPFYKALVIVEDTLGNPIEEAEVRLYAPVNDNQVDTTQETNAQGIVEFEFELDAVLNIDAVKGTWTGSGFVQLKENETVEETIILRP